MSTETDETDRHLAAEFRAKAAGLYRRADGMPLSHKDGTMDRHVELKAEADRLMERAEKLDPIITDITKGA